jgi:uroporphyrinogen-III synthase
VEGALAGVRVLVPRAAAQGAALATRLRAWGAEAVVLPVLDIAPGDADGLAAAAKRLLDGDVDLVAFTSRNAVAPLAAALASLGAGYPGGSVRTVAVGPGTAATVREVLGVDPELPAGRATGRDLGLAIGEGRGTVLLPRGDLASSELPTLLRDNGYMVTEVVAYRTRLADALPADHVRGIRHGGIDVLALSSPSMVRALRTLVGAPPWMARVATIGPVTSAACRAVGLPVDAEAASHDLEGLVAAVVTAVGRG